MNGDKDVRRWYSENGVPYIDSDWGPRSETGEGLAADPALPREGHDRVSIRDENQLTRLEEQGRLRFPWLERLDNDQLEALEEFLTPYMANLPRAQARVLDVWMYGRKSQRQVADELGITQANVSKRLRAAGRRMVREIAAVQRFMLEVVGEDPLDDMDDGELAWCAFNTYWKRRFGRAYS